jgi:hypothetical protein
MPLLLRAQVTANREGPRRARPRIACSGQRIGPRRDFYRRRVHDRHVSGRAQRWTLEARADPSPGLMVLVPKSGSASDRSRMSMTLGRNIGDSAVHQNANRHIGACSTHPCRRLRRPPLPPDVSGHCTDEAPDIAGRRATTSQPNPVVGVRAGTQPTSALPGRAVTAVCESPSCPSDRATRWLGTHQPRRSARRSGANSVIRALPSSLGW